MVRQRRAYGVHWELPGGYCEASESLEQAAAREVLEEANVPVEVGPLVCTMVWEREHDARRNVLAWFSATVADASAMPQPQIEEDIEAAAFLDPEPLADQIHPLERVVIDRWWNDRDGAAFHIHGEVTVQPDGTQRYAFRT